MQQIDDGTRAPITEGSIGFRGLGHTGWGQRPGDLRHPALDDHAAGTARRLRTRRWIFAFAAVGFALGLLVATWDLGSDPLATELEERSQPPTVEAARLVDDETLEVVADVPDGAELCAEQPEALAGPADDGPPPCGTAEAGRARVPLADVEIDVEELIGEELVVTAHDTIEAPSEDVPPGDDSSVEVASDPSPAVTITDER